MANAAVFRVQSSDVTGTSANKRITIEDSQIAILSTLAQGIQVALPKVNDGSTDTVDANADYVGVYAQNDGYIEVLDNLGRRLSIVPGWSQKVFRAVSSGQSSDNEDVGTSLGGHAGTFWVEAHADTVHPDTSLMWAPISAMAGAITPTSQDVDSTDFKLGGNFISTLLNPAGAAGDSLSCASTLGGSDWVQAASVIAGAVDTYLLNWASHAIEQCTSTLEELENAVNQSWTAMSHAGLTPGLGVFGKAAGVLSTIALTSQSTDYEFYGDGFSPGASRPAGPTSSGQTSGQLQESASAFANRYGYFIVSSSIGRVTGGLDFPVAVVLSEIGASETGEGSTDTSDAGSSTVATSGDLVTIDNTGLARIDVVDFLRVKLGEVRPGRSKTFMSITSDVGWKDTGMTVLPGFEGLGASAPKTSAGATSTIWGPFAFTYPSLSCLTTPITSLPDTYASATVSTALAAAGAYAISQVTSMNRAAFAEFNIAVNTMIELCGALDLSSYST